MLRGVRARAGERQRRTVRGPRVHVAIRFDPTRERSQILGAFSTIDRAKQEIESLETVTGWIHLPTNPFWVSDPTRTSCYWEILDLDVDWSLSRPATDISTTSRASEVESRL